MIGCGDGMIECGDQLLWSRMWWSRMWWVARSCCHDCDHHDERRKSTDDTGLPQGAGEGVRQAWPQAWTQPWTQPWTQVCAFASAVVSIGAGTGAQTEVRDGGRGLSLGSRAKRNVEGGNKGQTGAKGHEEQKTRGGRGKGQGAGPQGGA